MKNTVGSKLFEQLHDDINVGDFMFKLCNPEKHDILDLQEEQKNKEDNAEFEYLKQEFAISALGEAAKEVFDKILKNFNFTDEEKIDLFKTALKEY